MFRPALQLTAPCATQSEADATLAACRGLEGCMGARILPPKYPSPSLVVQAIYPDAPACDLLPLGMRRVMVNPSFLTTLNR